MLSTLKKQSINEKFLFKTAKILLNLFFLETELIVNFYHVSVFFKWFKCIQANRENIDNDTHLDRPTQDKILFVGLCSFTMFLKVNLLISITTLKSLPNSVKNMTKNGIVEKQVMGTSVCTTPVHTVLAIKTFLTKYKITVFDYPTSETDLPPCNFYLFSKIRSTFKKTWFQTLEFVK